MKLQALLMQFFMSAQNGSIDDVDRLIAKYIPKIKATKEYDLLLTEKQVVEKYPALHLNMLRHMRQMGTGPSFLKTGLHRNSRIFYKVSDIEKWVASLRSFNN